MEQGHVRERGRERETRKCADHERWPIVHVTRRCGTCVSWVVQHYHLATSTFPSGAQNREALLHESKLILPPYVHYMLQLQLWS